MSKLQGAKQEETGAIPGELITKKELAHRLRTSQRKIELDPKFPSIRWGRNVRYDWAEVVAYLKGGTAA